MQRRPITIKLTIDQLNAYIQERVKIHLKDYLKLYSEVVIVDELILFTENEDAPLLDLPELIFEKEAGRSLKGTKYTYRIDNPRGEAGTGNQRHIHVLLKNKEVFAMNVDGSAHDGPH